MPVTSMVKFIDWIYYGSTAASVLRFMLGITLASKPWRSLTSHMRREETFWSPHHFKQDTNEPESTACLDDVLPLQHLAFIGLYINARETI